MIKDSYEIATERVLLLSKLQQAIDLLHAQLKRQQEYLHNDDVNAFMESMSENRERLGEMEELMQSLQRLQEQPASQTSRAMEEGISLSLRQLQETERLTNTLANEKLENYRKNVREIRLVKKGAKSYLNPYSKVDGMYIDKKK